MPDARPDDTLRKALERLLGAADHSHKMNQVTTGLCAEAENARAALDAASTVSAIDEHMAVASWQAGVDHALVHHHATEADCRDFACQLNWNRPGGSGRPAPARVCRCTADTQLAEAPGCAVCGHRDHGRSGCGALVEEKG